MSDSISGQLNTNNDEALFRARAALEKINFQFTDERTAQGRIAISGSKIISLTIKIPPAFPYELPIISIDRSTLPKTIAHVERSGKICVAPSTGVLLDTDNIEGLIYESLDKAKDAIKKGFLNQDSADIQEEFTAYWSNSKETLWSIFDPEQDSRIIYEISIQNEKERKTLIADTMEQARVWSYRLGWSIEFFREIYYIKLERNFTPPKFEDDLKFNHLKYILKCGSPKDYMRFLLWFIGLNNNKPMKLILSMPNTSENRSVVAVLIHELPSNIYQYAQKGFRSDRTYLQYIVSFFSHKNITRINVQRRDYKYLLSRGGIGYQIYQTCITVIGCGAVGSRIVENLAILGIGHIKIIDCEDIAAENAHRHILGMDSVGKQKVSEIKLLMNRRFPHIEIEENNNSVQDILSQNPSFIMNSDLVIIALGDETLELKINRILQDKVRRIHVWLDPLDIGGHILVTGVEKDQGGCYQCLFIKNSQTGLYNKASFVEAGQIVQRSIAGCAGVFSPYSGLHASKAALEAVRIASEILQEQLQKNVLISWMDRIENFVAMGFQVSERAKSFNNNETKRDYQFRNLLCNVCESKYD